MNYKKITFGVLLCCFGIQAILSQTALFVKVKSGANTPYNLTTLKSLTFEDGKVKVNKKDASFSTFVRTDIQHLTFAENITTELVSQNTKNKLRIYPNPVVDILNIELESTFPLQIEIVSIDARVVLSTILLSNKSSISVTSLPKGLYLLRSSIGTAKFIK